MSMSAIQFSFFNQKRHNTDDFHHLKKVNYSIERPIFLPLQPRSPNIFFTKSKEWKYEEEWRILLPLTDAKKSIKAKPYKIYLFSFPLEIIKGIFCGCRMTQYQKDKIKKTIKKNTKCSHIKVFQAYTEEKTFALRFEQINI